jgi:hypothetical protein
MVLSRDSKNCAFWLFEPWLGAAPPKVRLDPTKQRTTVAGRSQFAESFKNNEFSGQISLLAGY